MNRNPLSVPVAISLAEELLFQFVDELPWPVIVISDDGQVMRVTRELQDNGLRQGTGFGSSFEALFPEYFSVLKGDVRWRVAQEVEVSRQLVEGTVRERLILRRFSNEAFHATYLIVVDQTKLRMLETTNAQTVRLAALGFMMAGVCHEVSNPLTSIHSMIQILRSDKSIDHDLLDRGLNNIAANVKRLLDISRRLVNFGRVGDEPRAAFAIETVIEEAFAVIGQDRRREQVKFNLAAGNKALVFGSSSQMQEVFVNIFENALQSMNDVGTLSVRTWSQMENEQVIVTISDTGPGIPFDVLPKIFDPFFTTKSVGRGTGLGLAISQEIVREHDGSIIGYNNPDGGACFRIELPTYKEKP